MVDDSIELITMLGAQKPQEMIHTMHCKYMVVLLVISLRDHEVNH